MAFDDQARLLVTGGGLTYGYVYRYGPTGAFDTALYAKAATGPFDWADSCSTLLPDGSLVTALYPIASDREGNRYVCDGNGNYNNPTPIHKLASDGRELTSWSVDGLVFRMAMGPDGNLYLNRYGIIPNKMLIASSLYVYDPDGKLLRTLFFGGPEFLGLDAKGRLYVQNTSGGAAQYSNAGVLLIPDVLSGAIMDVLPRFRRGLSRWAARVRRLPKLRRAVLPRR